MRLEVSNLICKRPASKFDAGPSAAVDDTGEITLFGPVSFVLDTPDDHLIVVGPSGCGKTTLLRAIAALNPLSPGSSVTLNGEAADNFGIQQWRRTLTFVSQKPAVVSGTPREYFDDVCTFAANADHAAFFPDPAAIAAAWHLPDGTFERPWSDLSGGEQQRAFLAISVAISDPEGVLLLDEPTASLDDSSKGEVERFLIDRSFVWVTHDVLQAERLLDLCAEHGTTCSVLALPDGSLTDTLPATHAV